MKSLFLGLLLIGCCVGALAQNIKLINSGEVIEQSRVLKDSSRFEDAIKLLLTVPARDTNYVFMLSELAHLYNSNKQYDKALETAEEVLKDYSAYEVDMLRTKGVALFNLDKFELAVQFLEKEVAKRPFEYKLLYALGTIHYDHKDYEKAADYFFRILSFYPFHAGSHLNLGRIAILNGRKTHGMMALGVYLSINNNDNSKLVLLNNFLSSQVPEDGSVTTSFPNSCEKLDQIIRSKIALDASFKTKVQFKVAVVSQFEMFFNQLSTIKPATDDRWVTHYLPIYTAIKDQGLMEPFLYFLVKSSGNDDIKKWLNKNEKILNTFFSNINDVMKKDRTTVNTGGAYGFTGRVPAWYDDKNQLFAFGKKVNDKEEGRWVYLSETTSIKAEGEYGQGKKKGIWKYYYPSGTMKNHENYETGEVTIYNEDGTKNEHFYLKDGITEGNVRFFYSSGEIADIVPYKKGLRDGKGDSYYASGKKELSYEYVEGKPTGRWVDYAPTGQIVKIRNIKEGYLHGEFQENYSSGKPKASGNYVEGKESGTWKYFHSNGKPEKSGEYKNGVGVGEWIFYDTQGEVTSRGTLNENGQWHGSKTNYYDGKPRSVQTFKDGIITRIVYYDWNGREVGNFGNSNGTFNSKIFFVSGQLNGEGAYKNGDLQGKWTYYFPEGNKLSEYTYEAGQNVGTGFEYYRTGEKRYILQYENDQLHGYFQEFYPTGSIKSEGWYQNGQREQQWLTYYANGKIETDYYYLNGQLYGDAHDHNTDGKVYMTTHFGENGKIVDFKRFDQSGNQIIKRNNEKGITHYEAFFTNGKQKYKSTLLNGKYNEPITHWLPDGSIYYTFDFSQGERNGLYKTHHPNGQLEAEGRYADGSREGNWNIYYGNGVIDNNGVYINGMQDSIWTYYFPFGKVSSTARFRDDDRDGVVRYYSPDGTPLVEKFFEAGQLLAHRAVDGNGQFGEWRLFTGNETIQAKYPNGIVAYEEPFKKGLQNGIRRLNYSSGKPCLEYILTNGDYAGFYNIYYPNGNPFQKKVYKNDELYGVVETFSPDGSPLYTETFLNSQLNGKTVVYKQGKQYEINFWAGLPDQ